jgi:mannose-1-phosphate guanylyltransferase
LLRGKTFVKRAKEKLHACAVILAGGRGTRFWPRSRTRTPKQLLNIIGTHTMLQQTAARLSPTFRPTNLWIVTNEDQAAEVRKQLPRVAKSHVLTEPIGRNTAAAIGLAAIHLRHTHGDALMAVLPADHFIAQSAKYRALVQAALRIASGAGQMAVLGIPPTRPETGFGYIERGKGTQRSGKFPVHDVCQFTEKPSLAVARKYVAFGRYFWNAGMFFWRVSTFLENLCRYVPKTHAALEELARTIGTPRYANALRKIYPRLENISVDYAILEPATRNAKHPVVHVLPAEIGWSDIGSWEAVYELIAATQNNLHHEKNAGNISAGPHFTIDAANNFLWSPKKFVAAIGVNNLVVVETPDALLICPRNRAQDVGKIVKYLESRKLNSLL